MNRRSFTFAEFFAGIGLVRLALERRGWSAVFANDNDPKKAAMYLANFAADELCTADVREVTGASVPPCDLFTASFPCNDLSVAGAKAGLAGTHSGMFWEFLRIVEEQGNTKPPLILLENVVGFLTSRGGQDFAEALLALAALGYVVDAMVINASHFTAQSRPRLFVVAKRQALPEPCEPAVSSVRPPALVRFIEDHPEIPWDLRSLPSLPPIEHRLAQIVERLPPNDPLWWSEPRARYFYGQLSERHRAIADEMIAAQKTSFATAYRRMRRGRSMAELRTDGLAGCLRTPRGGSGRQILFQAGRGEYAVRLLSARECARLQGVPDSFKIEARLNQALFGFGDAVCVPVIEWIAEHYLTPCAQELAMGERSS